MAPWLSCGPQYYGSLRSKLGLPHVATAALAAGGGISEGNPGREIAVVNARRVHAAKGKCRLLSPNRNFAANGGKAGRRATKEMINPV